jgi:hypothetical protein
MPSIEIRNLPVNPNPLALSDILPVDPSATTTTVSNTVHDIVCAGPGNTASGLNSRTEGALNTASGAQSHAEGDNTTASANNAHSEGTGTIASGLASHAEGTNCHATGNYSHAEGNTTVASGIGSHAEGAGSTTSGNYSHVEGETNTVSESYSHIEGFSNAAASTASPGAFNHIEGANNTISGNVALCHIEGDGNLIQVSLSSPIKNSNVGGNGAICTNNAEWARGINPQGGGSTPGLNQIGIITFYNSTINATPTTLDLAGSSIAYYETYQNTAYFMTVDIVANSSAGSAIIQQKCLVSNSSGTITITNISGPTVLASTGTLGSAIFALSSSGAKLIVTVTGILATTIFWSAKIEYTSTQNQ